MGDFAINQEEEDKEAEASKFRELRERRTSSRLQKKEMNVEVKSTKSILKKRTGNELDESQVELKIEEQQSSIVKTEDVIDQSVLDTIDDKKMKRPSKRPRPNKFPALGGSLSNPIINKLL